jgi:hypothetical protein
MRVISERMTEAGRMSIFSWNEKYLIKFEVGLLEQTYKVAEWDVSNVDELVQRAIQPAFLNSVNQRFDAMMKDLNLLQE